MTVINLTEHDNNKTIKAQKGDKVVITLSWNPSTGYFWQEMDTTAGVLEQLRHEGGDPIPGGSVLVHFTFRIEREGVIQLSCARPWAETQPPAKWFQVQIIF